MKTTENNKLIAEFIQFEQLKNNHYECIINNETKILPPQSMLFHNDWNWLMEVVEKILNLKDTYAQERQKVFNSINPNIQITYNACVDFIKWYNQQTK